MESLKLIRPTMEYADQIMDFRRECLEAGSRMDGCGPMRREQSAEEWLAEVEKYTRPETLPEGKVLATQFISVRQSDNRLVGLLQMRHTLNEQLRQFGGHIGYTIRPSERRKGYAKEQLRLCLDWCREELKMDRVLIFCENEASSRTVLANGGVYDGTVQVPDEDLTLERFWVSL